MSVGTALFQELGEIYARNAQIVRPERLYFIQVTLL